MLSRNSSPVSPIRRTSRLVQFRELGILGAALLLFVIVAAIAPVFLRYDNLQSVMLYIPMIVVVSMGEMLVILTRNWDLSVGSIVGFSGIAVGLLFVKYDSHFSVVLAFVLGTLIGGGLGLVNGFLITTVKLPSVIVTLGTLSVYRGILFIICGGKQIDPNYIPQKLINLSRTADVLVPDIVIIAVVIAVLMWLFLRFSHLGKEVYAVGSNPTAAALRGISANKILLLVFAISGACAGFGGIMYASLYGYVNPGMTGVGFEFVVISATIIGGTSVAGGSGSVLGTVIGCVLLGIANTALAVLGVSGTWQEASYGLIIVAALVLDKSIQQRVLSMVKSRRGI